MDREMTTFDAFYRSLSEGSALFRLLVDPPELIPFRLRSGLVFFVQSPWQSSLPI